MKHDILAFLSIALVSSGPAVEAGSHGGLFDRATTTFVAQIPSPGTRVRINTGEVVEAPGLATIRRQVLNGTESVLSEGRPTSSSGVPQTLAVTSEAGDQVILPAPSAQFIGEVVQADVDTLVIRLDGREVRLTIPLASVTAIDRSLGQTRRGRGTTAFTGLLIGAGVGFFLGVTSGEDQCESSGELFSFCLTFTPVQKGIMLGSLLAGGGGILGLAFGGRKIDRWEPIKNHTPRNVEVSFRPTGLRSGSLAISF